MIQMIEFNATFIVALLSFAVFIIIMNAIFYNPILNIIKKRETYINSNTNKAEENNNTAKEYINIHSEKIEEKQDECREKFKSSIEILQENSTKEISNAREISKTEIQSQKENLAQKSNELKTLVEKTVVEDLANSITKKITQGVIQ